MQEKETGLFLVWHWKQTQYNHFFSSNEKLNYYFLIHNQMCVFILQDKKDERALVTWYCNFNAKGVELH